jgi:tetratricopeptide (TPR) repeat protein
MTASYSDRNDVDRFARGELSAEDNRRLIRRLLAAYGLRESDFAPLQSLPVPERREAPGRRGSLGESAEDVLARHALDLAERADQLERERVRAPGLSRRLALLPREGRKVAIRRDSSFHTWSLCEWLIERCHDLVHEETSEAEELAECAVTVAEELDPKYYGEGLVRDIQARAWAAIAEVLRMSSDLRSSEEAFELAETLVADGTGDALEEGWILELKATLRRDQQRTEEAQRLLDEVVSIYRQYRDFHLVGRAFVQKGRAFGAAGDAESAIHWLRKGLALVDPAREPRLELQARHSLMLSLHESGRHREAWFMLQATRPDFVQHGGGLLSLRLRWLEGKIQLALGRLAEAEAALSQARRGFEGQENGFDAALVCLDLAGLYAGQGRASEMRRLAEEMLPIFSARDLHREAIAALIVFQQAARMERVNADLLEEIGTYLRRARRNYKLRFKTAA